jgi:NAD+ kinase
MRAAVFTHRRAGDTRDALPRLRALARDHGVQLCFDGEEVRKHALQDEPTPPGDDVDLCLVLGGDGTILHALRSYARTSVPVFGINFGEVGFLAAVDRESLDDGLRRAFSGDFERLPLPGVELVADGSPDAGWTAYNDVSMHRQPGLRVADLAYRVGDEEVGRVRCDGLVVATPAGSTGYNLANGGPVMAWGVEGFAVSFIAPHSLTARALIVAPSDVLTICNRSRDEPVDVTVDGRPVCELPSGDSMRARFVERVGVLGQMPEASFYHRLRQKFGRLATGV